MAGTQVDKILKDIQTIVNKRHYAQYILPLVEAMESTNNKINAIKVKSIVEKIIASSITRIASRGVEIDNVGYISIDDVSQIIKEEMNTYL